VSCEIPAGQPASSFAGNVARTTDEAFRGARWYALHTRSRHEKRVREQLAGRPGIKVFLPLWQRRSRWKDRTKTIEIPLFPGYCFAQFRDADQLRNLRLFGVLELAGPGGHPEPVPETEIDAIRSLLASGLRYDPHPFLSHGAEVEVVRGPLIGVRGRVVRKDRACHVVLSVALIRQAVSVEIDADSVDLSGVRVEAA
jgi:transcription termination/antitermination protein NusG